MIETTIISFEPIGKERTIKVFDNSDKAYEYYSKLRTKDIMADIHIARGFVYNLSKPIEFLLKDVYPKQYAGRIYIVCLHDFFGGVRANVIRLDDPLLYDCFSAIPRLFNIISESDMSGNILRVTTVAPTFEDAICIATDLRTELIANKEYNVTSLGKF